MDIVLSPDPTLREVCEPYEIGDRSVRKLAKQMLKTMYRSDGVGLAAPQVGVLKRMVVIDVEWPYPDEDGRSRKNPLVLVNPQIVWHSDETEVADEGCLSLPGINVPVERWTAVTVKCLDENYDEVVHEGEGFFARCMQHELDHLDGVTMLERLNPVQRMKAIALYKEALARGARPGETS